MNKIKLTPIAFVSFLMISGAYAQTSIELNSVTVIGSPEMMGAQSISGYGLSTRKATSNSTGELLQEIPGAYVYNGGGLSSLPMIHGLGDDRLKVTVDGMDLFAACPNHMNSPLSYIDPSKVENITVYSGVAPVSVSSDSLGGTIIVSPAKPQFANSGDILTTGELGGYYRSNGNAFGGNAKATIANDQFSLTYTGSEAKSDDYKAGKDFKNYTTAMGMGGVNPDLAKNIVGSTFYKAFNQELALGMLSGTNLFELKVGVQNIPYEGFVNQYMDMLSNKSTQISLRYEGKFDGANIDAQVYHQTVAHYMNFGNDRQFVYGPDSGMPMNTASGTTGFKSKITKELSDNTLVRVGVDVEQYHLNDWWPASPGDQGYGMGPNAYQNMNNGKRNVYSIFGELENKLTAQLSSIVGVRYELVKESTGAITSAYCTDTSNGGANCSYMPYTIDPRYTSGQSRQDNNLDVSAIFKYVPSSVENYQLGFSRNAKSPNLYALYAWGYSTAPNMTYMMGTGMPGMTTPMNNFIGDGNGYVGNPDLKPEVANKISFDANWHDAEKEVWSVRFSPYYTYVQNYISSQCASTALIAGNSCSVGQYNILQYVNQNAQIYGADLSGKTQLGYMPSLGSFSLSGVVSYVRGKNETTGGNLYNMMPLNARVALSDKVGNWTTVAEAQFVKAKTDVNNVQNEIATPGYSLFNLRSTWAEQKYSVTVGIDNIFNKFYYLPLGGAYVGQGTTMALNSANNGTLSAVPGMGRSFYTRFNAKF